MGAELLVICFAPPKSLAAHLAMMPQPFPVVCDPERKAYQAFGLGRTRLWTFFRPDVLWHYLRLIFRGWRPRKVGEDNDVWQLGGDFVLDAAGRVIFAQPSRDAADRPTNEALLTALRSASTG